MLWHDNLFAACMMSERWACHGYHELKVVCCGGDAAAACASSSLSRCPQAGNLTGSWTQESGRGAVERSQATGIEGRAGLQ